MVMSRKVEKHISILRLRKAWFLLPFVVVVVVARCFSRRCRFVVVSSLLLLLVVVVVGLPNLIL